MGGVLIGEEPARARPEGEMFNGLVRLLSRSPTEPMLLVRVVHMPGNSPALIVRFLNGDSLLRGVGPRWRRMLSISVFRADMGIAPGVGNSELNSSAFTFLMVDNCWGTNEPREPKWSWEKPILPNHPCSSIHSSTHLEARHRRVWNALNQPLVCRAARATWTSRRWCRTADTQPNARWNLWLGVERRHRPTVLRLLSWWGDV